MKVKVFQPNPHGKIEFTRTELEKLLNEIYEEGRRDCERNHIYPFIYNTPYYGDSITDTITTCGTGTCINSTNATDSVDKLTCDSAVATDGVYPESLSTPTFTVSISDINADGANQDKIVQHIQDTINNFKKVHSNDPFSMLAKELNF